MNQGFLWTYETARDAAARFLSTSPETLVESVALRMTIDGDCVMHSLAKVAKSPCWRAICQPHIQLTFASLR